MTDSLTTDNAPVAIDRNNFKEIIDQSCLALKSEELRREISSWANEVDRVAFGLFSVKDPGGPEERCKCPLSALDLQKVLPDRQLNGFINIFDARMYGMTNMTCGVAVIHDG